MESPLRAADRLQREVLFDGFPSVTGNRLVEDSVEMPFVNRRLEVRFLSPAPTFQAPTNSLRTSSTDLENDLPSI
jgi:hypothetical protein